MGSQARATPASACRIHVGVLLGEFVAANTVRLTTRAGPRHLVRHIVLIGA